ncbi:hypothetical protein F5B19DRAFT_498132 [Rostrohypoxylon terebratum]|nr:hypothetical protein F5B19DRAFT_498132 [Rostrohypoxylon terebratum]
MAPFMNEYESAYVSDVGVNSLKQKAGASHVEIAATAKPPVADDYMYDFKYNHALPTSDVLGVEIPVHCDAQREAESILARLSEVLGKGDAQGFTDLFLDYGVWRDKLSFTWDYRTFNFKPAILKAATDLFSHTKATNLKFLTPAPTIHRPYPDYAYLQFIASFETDVVVGSAAVTSVLTKDGWKIYHMHTVAEKLKQFPELPVHDGYMTGLISWEKQRGIDVDTADPEVLIIGGGQNGLALAARCKALGLDNLIIERSEEIGEVWTKRYEYLSLHFPHWADDLPYFPYPKRWPSYTPAQKQGCYMQRYASALELNIWTKSSVVKAEQDDQGNWTVVINKGGKESRTLHPKQVVLATSLLGVPKLPDTPGMDIFKGVIRHSSAHDSSRDFVGKKLCQDCAVSFRFGLALRPPVSTPPSTARAAASTSPSSNGRQPTSSTKSRTGFSDTINSVGAILGDKIADKVNPIWGIDEEGEIKSAYRETGVPNLWLMVGYLPYTRYHSALLAMRLKALKEGIATAPYTK